MYRGVYRATHRVNKRAVFAHSRSGYGGYINYRTIYVSRAVNTLSIGKDKRCGKRYLSDTTLRIRKNISSISAEERARYVQGVKLLKEQGLYNPYVETHGESYDYDAAHGVPAFLPWHRTYLLKFEADLQTVLNDPSYCLPYWDWSADRALDDPTTALVWNDEFMGGSGSPVKSGPFVKSQWDTAGRGRRGLRRTYDKSSLVAGLPTPKKVADNSLVTPYDKFRPDLESNIHNPVHVGIGGDMLLGTSPDDPVFFLHHCNVDRLWAEWQVKQTVPR